MLEEPLSNIFCLTNINPTTFHAFDPIDMEWHSLRGGADVRRSRPRRPQNLITESISFFLWQPWNHVRRDKPSEIAASFPTLQIFKTANR
jgi:hypothetical protein